MSQYAELNTTMEEAAFATAAGKTIEQIVKICGVDRRTVCRWRREPQFLRAVQDFREQLFAQVIGKVGEGANKAIDTLIALCDSESEPMRLEAATTLLEACAGKVDLAQLAKEAGVQLDGEPRGDSQQPQILVVPKVRQEIADAV